MNPRAGVAATVLALALALPTAAGAHTRVSPQSVAKHVRSADQALRMVESLVSRNQDAQAAVRLARMRAELRAADREARRLRARARGKRGRVRAAAAYRRTAREHDRVVGVLAEIVDEAGGALQVDLAELLKAELQRREQALDALKALLPGLPDQVQELVSKLLSQVSSDDPAQLADLLSALRGGQLSPEAGALLEDALAQLTAAIDEGIARLHEVVGLVPEEARPFVEQALDAVVAGLEQLKASLSQLLGGLSSPGAELPGGTPTSPLGLICGLSLLPIQLPICGS